MTRSNLVLLGGVAAVVAGVFSFCVNALYTLFLLRFGVVPFVVTPLMSLAGIATTLLYAVGLAGLYASIGRRSRLGVAGLVLVCLSLLATPISWAVGATLFVYRNAVGDGALLRNSLAVSGQYVVGGAGSALLAGAVLLLAVAALHASALGRWTFVPFAIGLVSLAPLLFSAAYGLDLGVPGWAFFSPPLLRAPLWVLLGVVLWQRAPGMGPDAIRAREGGVGRA